MHTHVHSSIIPNSQKMKATQVTADKSKGNWNVVYIHTMEYYSALKRKKILRRATTWMNLEDIMLSDRSQSQKDKTPYSAT